MKDKTNLNEQKDSQSDDKPFQIQMQQQNIVLNDSEVLSGRKQLAK